MTCNRERQRKHAATIGAVHDSAIDCFTRMATIGGRP